MVRYQVILAYDGTEFRGFQRQPAGQTARTVQATVEEALRKVGWQGQAILAAGRTDTGVHASGQVIAFDLEWKHTLRALQDALNALLPEDVAVRQVMPTRPDFHPRYDALARRYHYHIFCQPVRDPLRERYAWRVWPAVDELLLQEAANRLVGRHDFVAFGSPPRTGGNTIRAVHLAEWRSEEDDLLFCVEANAFLYHMVRHLVFVQVAIGQGRLAPDELLSHLDQTGLQTPLQGLAPASGLSLVKVTYREADCSEETARTG